MATSACCSSWRVPVPGSCAHPLTKLHESEATERHQIALAGPLRPGPLMEFEVPDRNQLSLYRVRVVQVTGEDYGLRAAGEYRAVLRY